MDIRESQKLKVTPLGGQESQKFPDSPGVYIMKDKNAGIIYIGKAVSLRKRVRSYFERRGRPRPAPTYKTDVLMQNVSDIDYIVTGSEEEALLLEAALVKQNQPRYNILLKDDKRYPLLKLSTEEKIPKLSIVRRKYDDNATYFGPYTNARLLRKAVSSLRLIFRLSPCLPPLQQGYAQVAHDIKLFLNGRKKELIENLADRMKKLSDERMFEAAAAIRDQINALTAVAKNTHCVFFKRIEGFDISDISGKEAVGAMVSFYNGKPDKSNYRKYRIKAVSGIDDYKMIEEVLIRRYKRLVSEKLALPDLIIIDGGKGHVGVARSALDNLGLNKINVFGIAKKKERIFSAIREERVSDELKRLIQAVRDEAHRFAQSYHHVLRRRKIIGK